MQTSSSYISFPASQRLKKYYLKNPLFLGATEIHAHIYSKLVIWWERADFWVHLGLQPSVDLTQNRADLVFFFFFLVSRLHMCQDFLHVVIYCTSSQTLC
ncbi:hypothetical protein GDO81_011075 [Engystomops pustulosus]|uniref:Uncharacterized protein n=1 Tax=Engystomops pustulosus TaxID=76066 RepID=A0AAV7C4E6_ENGPU|nr:hypothetical protein GDO81_011075 [Engystomops pustulosus]